MKSLGALARIWLPLAISVATLAVREAIRQDAASVTARPRSTELPAARTGASPRREVGYELDAEASSIRFLLCDGRGEWLFACPLARGTLQVSPAVLRNELELTFDLASLAPADGGDGGAAQALREVLAAHCRSEITFRGDLRRRTETAFAGLQEDVWQGELRFGSRCLAQTMVLWQTALPGRPLRLQGHGTVLSLDYGISRFAWFGLVARPVRVTIGLDLAFARRAGS